MQQWYFFIGTNKEVNNNKQQRTETQVSENGVLAILCDVRFST